ncbi:MAG: DUF1572 family protein [Acidobacteriota bacterium]
MLKDATIELFERDLNKLIAEINSYLNEEDLWIKTENIPNSAGNLCLHLVGNLNHYVGATLGNSGYVRKRDEEFSTQNISRNELIERVKNTIEVVKNTINKLSDNDFEKIYPLQNSGESTKTNLEILKILTHFSYHLGQINYHRRMLQNG